MRGKEKCKSQKQNIAVAIILGILFGAIFIGIYKNSNTHIKNNSEVENIGVITNMDERLSIDLSEYGKETPEDVFVEFIQAVCDDDPERLMHTLSPYLLNSVLALPVDIENYQDVLDCFIDYELHVWGILSRKYEVWECKIEKMEKCDDEELQNLNDDLQEQLHYSDNNNIDITDAVNIYLGLKLENEEESSAVQVFKIDERWYVNLNSL